MSYNTKKPYNKGGSGGNYSKAKSSEVDKWGHDGFDKLQQEREKKPFQGNKNSKPKKDRRSYNNGDKTMNADQAEYLPQYEKSKSNKSKWQHDKFSDFGGNADQNDNSQNPREQVTYTQKEKRPEVQYYVPKQIKRNNTNNSNTSNNNNNPNNNSGSNTEQKSKKDEDDSISAVDENEMRAETKDPNQIEDDKSTVSTGSTSVSEKSKPNNNEQAPNKEVSQFNVSGGTPGHQKFTRQNSTSKEKKVSKSPEQKENKSPRLPQQNQHSYVDDPRLMLEIVLDPENSSKSIKIFDFEENIEAVLDKKCAEYKLENRFALHFKIYVLKILRDQYPNVTRKTEGCFARLLEENYKLLMQETYNIFNNKSPDFLMDRTNQKYN